MSNCIPGGNEKPIAFLDSGIGGLPYLLWCKKNLSKELFLYFADRRHFPYGEKSVTEIKTIVIDLAGKIIHHFSPKIVVVACNTASVVALHELRERYSVPFIGVVPAVKSASAFSKKRKVGVLGSSRTVENDYTERLISDFASDCTVSVMSGHKIIDFVENKYLSASAREKERAVQPIADYCRDKDIDALVLGCTHFIFLNDVFQKSCGGKVLVIDSVEGVGKQVVRIAEKIGLRAEKKDRDIHRFYHSGDEDCIPPYKEYAERFGLTYCGGCAW